MDQWEHEAHRYDLDFGVQDHLLVDVRHSVAVHRVDCHIAQAYDHRPEWETALESLVRSVNEDRAWKFRIGGQEDYLTGVLYRALVHVSKQLCRDAEEC